jgi:hypothetical protein
VNRIPFSANESRLGVRISPPKQPRSEYPMSSAMIRRIFGFPESWRNPVIKKIKGKMDLMLKDGRQEGFRVNY